VSSQGIDAQGKEIPAPKPEDLGNEILDLLALRTENPSEAFILLQQLSIYLWDTYKIDWEAKENSPVAPDRKLRYLGFVAGLVDHLTGPENGGEAHSAGCSAGCSAECSEDCSCTDAPTAQAPAPEST
jgi:hypothetical protein